jgi:hypothetical protein
MIGSSNLHPLRQEAPLWGGGGNYGQADFGPHDLQNGKLLNQGLSLPLDIFLSMVGVSCPDGQAPEFRFGQVTRLACVRKLTLEKGNLPNRFVSLPTNISH